jgi:hypothetical protein
MVLLYDPVSISHHIPSSRTTSDKPERRPHFPIKITSIYFSNRLRKTTGNIKMVDEESLVIRNQHLSKATLECYRFCNLPVLSPHEIKAVIMKNSANLSEKEGDNRQTFKMCSSLAALRPCVLYTCQNLISDS